MGVPVFQVSLLTTLLIAACAMSPRSVGGEGGGGFGGGSGGGFGGGIGGGGGFGGGAGGESEGGQDYGGGLGPGDDDSGDGSEEGGGGGSDGSDGDGNEQGAGEDGEGEGDDDQSAEDGGDEGSTEGSGDGDIEEENGQNEDSDYPYACDEGGGWGSGDEKGKSSDHSIRSDKRKRSIKSLKSPDKGETAIPSSMWLSGKKAPRSHFYGYYYDGPYEDEINDVPPQDVTNIIAVIPWWFTQFTRGLSLRISPLPDLPGSPLLKHHVSGPHPHHRQRRDTNGRLRSKRDSLDEDMTEEESEQDHEEMETAEETPLEGDNTIEDSTAEETETVVEESPLGVDNIEQSSAEEIAGESEVGGMNEENETELTQEETCS